MKISRITVDIDDKYCTDTTLRVHVKYYSKYGDTITSKWCQVNRNDVMSSYIPFNPDYICGEVIKEEDSYDGLCS